MNRTPAADRALCLHEAAHAVTAEWLRPGCVVGVEMDYVPGTPDAFHGLVYGDDVEAVCNWEWWDPCLEQATAIAAGREGELIAPTDERYDRGDRRMLREGFPPWHRAKARRHARALVRKNELAVRRVAFALATNRTMTGREIRERIHA